jgi:hypothetical protein
MGGVKGFGGKGGTELGLGTRYEVRGTRFEVRGTRYEVRGSRFEVRGSRFEVRGSRFEVGWSLDEGLPGFAAGLAVLLALPGFVGLGNLVSRGRREGSLPF